MKTIEELLKSGRTPEELIAEIESTSKKLKAEEEASKKRKATLHKKRGAVISAILNYYEALDISPKSDKEINEFVNHMENIFDSIEKAVDYFDNVEIKTVNDDKDIINAFIKSLM